VPPRRPRLQPLGEPFLVLLELLADLAEFRLVDVDFGDGFEGL
jgi:hypothetical protein